MRFFTPVVVASLVLVAAVPSQASRIHRGPTSPKHKAAGHASSPRAMDDARATQIQGALVKAGYLTSVTGHWDSTSEAAMQKLQGDNGWQTKLIPDSRALIKLGLGPNSQTADAMPAPSSIDAEGTR